MADVCCYRRDGDTGDGRAVSCHMDMDEKEKRMKLIRWLVLAILVALTGCSIMASTTYTQRKFDIALRTPGCTVYAFIYDGHKYLASSQGGILRVEDE